MEMRRTIFSLLFIIFLTGGCKGQPPGETLRPVQGGEPVNTPNYDAINQTSIGNRGATPPRSAAARTIASLLVAPGIAGPFENGMNINDVYAINVPGGFKLVDLQNEGSFSPALEIRFVADQKDPALVASIYWICSRFSVYGISVRDAKYRTQEGLGVGSTLGDLRRYFKIDLPLEQSEDGDLMAITPGLTFALEYSDTPTDNSRVKAIWVYPDEDSIEKRWCSQRTRN